MTKEGSTTGGKAIAIIGMGCIFPKSRHLKAYWHLLFNGIDAIDEIPETHWKSEDYFDPDPAKPDHTYCKRGGFLPSITFDPLDYGIPPNNIEATDTSQLLGLEVARMALEDAGYPQNHPYLKEKKVNVILGVTGTQELVIPLGARLGHPIWKSALENAGIDSEKKSEILDRIQAGYVQWQENSFPGLLGNVVAGRIANRFDLSGTNTVSDAACASSLSALHTAVMELITNKCDMSITGGADTLNDIFMHMCFSKTGVLSHTNDARPFSKDADGTVLGEGIGMLVLKRLEDAQKDHDRIYAVIKGVGTSSDGKTSAIYAPDSEGQLKALKDAYHQCGVDPATVDLVEAHGTGTRVGDKVEFDALKKCFHKKELNTTAIGSVKSMIGHTKAAAGSAGMIKTILALHNKVIPPTLKADQPDPDLEINHSSFYLNNEAKPWINSSKGHPRRSGVSAFGFGGSNFHVVLEEYSKKKSHVSWDGSIQIFAFSGSTRASVKKDIANAIEVFSSLEEPSEITHEISTQAFESRQKFKSSHPARLAYIYKKGEDINTGLTQCLTCLENQANGKNIYLSLTAGKGKLGFLFPGQGSQYTGMGRELISIFPEAHDAMEEGCRIFQEEGKDDVPLQDYIFAVPAHVRSKKVSEEMLRRTNVAQPAIGAVSLGLIRILKRFGIRPDAACGHSFGELSALFSAGWIDEDTFLSLAVDRGKYMAQAGSDSGDSGSMLAVQSSLDCIEDLIRENNLSLVLANRNSHMQGVLSGDTQEILRAKKICSQNKIRAVQLPVAAAFHSKFVKDAAKPFLKAVNRKTISPTPVKVLSNTSGACYNEDESTAKELLGHQLANPVRFVDNIEKMASDGVTTFIEVGPKSVLTGLVRSILKGREITSIACDNASKKVSGLEKLAHVLAQVAVNGFDIDLSQWEEPVKKDKPKKMKISLSGANPKPVRKKNLQPSETGKLSKTAGRIHPQKPFKPVNRSEKKGSAMTTNRTYQSKPASSAAMETIQMVRQGLEALQQLQSQTARAHEKFLETQAQAGKALAGMMEQTRALAHEPSCGFSPVIPENQWQSNLKKERIDTPGHPAAAPIDPVFASTEPDHSQESIAKTASQIDDGQAVPVEPDAETPQDGGAPNADTLNILFGIVSDLTGFPVEMLEPEMDIESDLGIDSIKKVEIVSELEKKIPSCQGLTPESIGSVRTLAEICSAISGNDSSETSTEKEIEAKSDSSQDIKSVTESSVNKQKQTMDVLVETISELTGFPGEMLEPSMNLESDLGIDSIKRVEILSKLETRLDHVDSISPDDIGSLKTIAEIAAYLTDSTNNEEPIKKKLQKQEVKKKSIQPAAEKLTRQVVSLKVYPTNQIRFYNGAKIELPPGKTVYITRDSSEISSKFESEFQAAGIPVRQVDLAASPIPRLDDAAGIVLIPDAFKKQSVHQVLAFIYKAFELVKINADVLENAAEKKGAFLSAVTFMGGTFGFSDQMFKTDPLFGGLPGFIKTADLELKQVLCRSLDMPDDIEKCLENVEAATALLMTHGAVEMGLDGENCNIPELEEDPVENSVGQMSSDDVIVVTGGAKGVTADCAIELARVFSPTIVLVGRSDFPGDEPAWSMGIKGESDLKKAIFSHAFDGKKSTPSDVQKIYQRIVSGREIKDNMSRMEKYGSTVRYFSADVKDHKNIENICHTIRDKFGKIDGVIHGAGILEDKLISDKRVDQFSRVVETKVLGLQSLLRATKKDRLKYLVLFSSVAARAGNQGQSDYAVANEILNKTAVVYHLQHPQTRVVSINWGPWQGGMVDLSLKKEFEKRGIDLIPPEVGAKHLLAEMACSQERHPEVVIGAHLLNHVPPENKKDKPERILSKTFDDNQMPVLAWHRIAGEPVVPFALLMELQAQAAENANPGLKIYGMDNMRLLKGLVVKQPVIADINANRCKRAGNAFEAMTTITSQRGTGHEYTYASGVMRMNEKRPAPPVLSKAAFMTLKPYGRTIEDVYGDVLFHGKGLQSIVAVNGCSKKGIEVVTLPSPSPSHWLKGEGSSRWTLEPMMLDAAFQAAIIWTVENMGQACLPSYIANFRLYASFESFKGNIRILFTVNEKSKHRIKGYFTFLDASDTVIASITGFEAVVDPALLEKFKNRPLFNRASILSFAQGNPSEAFGEKYRMFDNDRQIARLPRPPYFFMDRVIKADHPQWQMEPGGIVETEYDVPADAWYFTANGSAAMPFCVLLEIALQPCGWLAAYAGSALHSDERLHFRNLGGKATLLEPLDRNCGTLTVQCTMKEVSKAGGMIIQDFSLTVSNRGRVVYEGVTNFGFFTGSALANQVGIRNSGLGGYQLPDSKKDRSSECDLLKTAPMHPDDPTVDVGNYMPSKALLMVDAIETFSPDGGLYNNGYIKAIKTIDPKEWFFDAHFYQDPVCPGSLGIESFLQLIRYYLIKTFDIEPDQLEPTLVPGHTHEWIYRGQIIPRNKKVEVHAHIKETKRAGEAYLGEADGAIVVDGICIYEMKDFGFAFDISGCATPLSDYQSLPVEKM